jgi:hypothetical protein
LGIPATLEDFCCFWRNGRLGGWNVEQPESTDGHLPFIGRWPVIRFRTVSIRPTIGAPLAAVSATRKFHEIFFKRKSRGWPLIETPR